MFHRDWADYFFASLFGSIGLLLLVLAVFLAGHVTSFFFDWPRQWEGGANTSHEKVDDTKTINGSLRIELQQPVQQP
jgi:hypothetical protein